jgi:uncharacterized protein
MIKRLHHASIEAQLGKGKAIILIGPRQVGKTTLIRQLVQGTAANTLWLTGDDPAVRAQLQDISLAALQNLVAKYEVLVIDEAQRLSNAGLTLKLITDHMPLVQLLVTGSSFLDLAAQTKENLTGRKREFYLYPLSFAEMSAHHGVFQEKSLLEQRMIYGYYPEVVQSSEQEAIKILSDLSEGLMYKDLLHLDQIKKPSLIVKLLQALALQLGSEVRYLEVGRTIGADPVTVEKYIDLLEKSFVIFRLSSFSRNQRTEIKKGRKVYFYDNGIRNAIIKNFAPLALRNDIGALWENFLLAERLKHNAYAGAFYNAYFWRTVEQQEVDYLEESNGQIHAYEFKWNPQKANRFPKTFLEAYPGSSSSFVHPGDFEKFVGWE